MTEAQILNDNDLLDMELKYKDGEEFKRLLDHIKYLQNSVRFYKGQMEYYKGELEAIEPYTKGFTV